MKTCPEQNINQEEFLTQIRMQVMSILLSLIEKEAASPEALQDVGKSKNKEQKKESLKKSKQ